MTKALIFNDAHVASSLTWPLNIGRQVAPGLHSGARLLVFAKKGLGILKVK